VGGPRRGARVVLLWFSGLYVLVIIVAIFLAGEGIFRLKNVVNSDDCSKKGVNVSTTDCVGNSNTLDAHRAPGHLPRALLDPVPDCRADRLAAR